MDAIYFPTLLRKLLPDSFFTDNTNSQIQIKDWRVRVINVLIAPLITIYNNYIDFISSTSIQHIARLQTESMILNCREITNADISMSDLPNRPYAFQITITYKMNIVRFESAERLVRQYVDAHKLAGTSFTINVSM